MSGMDRKQRAQIEELQQNCYDDQLWAPTGVYHAARPAPYQIEKLRESHRELFITDITPDKVHFGCFVILRIASLPGKQRGVIAVMEDQRGGVAQVRIFNYVSPAMKHGSPMNFIFYPENTMVLVEPWLGATKKVPGGEINKEIHVHNPCHFVLIHELHVFLTPLTWKNSRYLSWLLLAAEVEKREDHKESGNECFKNGDYCRAADYYTKSLIVLIDVNDERPAGFMQKVMVLLSNRSEALLQMQHHHLAYLDARNALFIETSHFKSISRLARALVGLHQFKRALEIVQAGLGIEPRNTGLLKLREEVARRLATPYHQREVDFKGMLEDSQQDARGEVRIMWPDFNGPFEARAASVCEGRGLFASRNIEPGDVVAVEKAVAVVYPSELDPPKVELDGKRQDLLTVCARSATELVWRLAVMASCVPEINAVVERLYDGSPHALAARRGHSDEELAARPSPTTMVCTTREYDIVEKCGVDVDHIEALMRCYTFAVETLHVDRGAIAGTLPCPAPPTGTALFNNCNVLNHSCVANCRRFIIGDFAVISAAKPIRAGEELTVAYKGLTSYLNTRKSDLSAKGFTCTCGRCLAERDAAETYDKLATRLTDLRNRVLEKRASKPRQTYEEICQILTDVEAMKPRSGELVARVYSTKRDFEVVLHMPEKALLSAEASLEVLRKDYLGHDLPAPMTVWRILEVVQELKEGGEHEKAREWRSVALDMARALVCNSDCLVSFLFNLDI